MFTRCPSCRAAFSITDQQLAIASGMVRCGVCEHVFDARLYLFKQAEEKTDQVDIPLDSDTETKIDAEIDVAAEAEFIQTEQFDTTNLDETFTQPAQNKEIEVPKIIADQVSSLDTDTTRLHPSHLFGLVAIGLLLVTLLVQLIAVYQNDLLPIRIRDAVCNWITCVYKVPRALNKIEILNRSIFTHPQHNNALMVTVTIINRAEFAQPYPIVQLRFLDVSGDVIAARQFNPQEYLGNTWSKQSIMQTARPTSIQLEVVDFGEEVVGYEFDFL